MSVLYSLMTILVWIPILYVFMGMFNKHEFFHNELYTKISEIWFVIYIIVAITDFLMYD